MKVYLAGPIVNCSYEEAVNWRKELAKELKKLKFDVLDPMKGKEFLKQQKKIGLSYEDNIFAKSINIFLTDLAKLNAADIVIFNFLNLKKFSIGSFFELGYSYAKNKTIIIITQDPDITEHPFVKNSAIVIPTIKETIKFLEKNF